MAANGITLFRLFLTFIVIAVFNRDWHIINIACIVTILIIFVLDYVDGIVARKRNETSDFGAVFDIAADRIIENIFWVYFSAIGMIPFWMPIAVLTRGFLTDSVRSMALQDGKTPFEMMSIPWARALTSSRFSRAFYGIIKMLTFIFLPTLNVLRDLYPANTQTVDTFSLVTMIIAYVTVAICLIRGFPVLIDGWKYIKANQ